MYLVKNITLATIKGFIVKKYMHLACVWKHHNPYFLLNKLSLAYIAWLKTMISLELWGKMWNIFY